MGIFITKEYIMKKIVRLTESDINRIVKRVISEQESPTNDRQMVSDLAYKLEQITKVPRKDMGQIPEILLGYKYNTQGNILQTNEDLMTRISNYEKYRNSKGLTQLPSGDLISLILTLK
jgi:phage gpG-like protein